MSKKARCANCASWGRLTVTISEQREWSSSLGYKDGQVHAKETESNKERYHDPRELTPPKGDNKEATVLTSTRQVEQ